MSDHPATTTASADFSTGRGFYNRVMESAFTAEYLSLGLRCFV
jgi:hypothetical protein